MKKVFEGQNSENMLGKPTRLIVKYVDEKNLFYTTIEGDDNVYVEFLDVEVCEQGERKNFMNRYTIPMKDFIKLRDVNCTKDDGGKY